MGNTVRYNKALTKHRFVHLQGSSTCWAWRVQHESRRWNYALELQKRHECCLKVKERSQPETFKEPEEASSVRLCRCFQVKDQSVLEQNSYRGTLKLLKLGRSYTTGW